MGHWLCLLGILSLVRSPHLGAITPALTTQDIERALKLGRASEVERATFHRRYVSPVPHSIVQHIEVISEFRRYVLKAEERLRFGDWLFSQGTRAAQEALRPWRGRTSIVAEIQFDPLNVYASLPPFVLLLGGTPRIDPLEGRMTPRWSPIQPRGRQSFLTGATIQLEFDSASVGQVTRPVSILLDGKELARVNIDFAALD